MEFSRNDDVQVGVADVRLILMFAVVTSVDCLEFSFTLIFKLNFAFTLRFKLSC